MSTYSLPCTLRELSPMSSQFLSYVRQQICSFYLRSNLVLYLFAIGILICSKQLVVYRECILSIVMVQIVTNNMDVMSRLEVILIALSTPYSHKSQQVVTILSILCIAPCLNCCIGTLHQSLFTLTASWSCPAFAQSNKASECYNVIRQKEPNEDLDRILSLPSIEIICPWP